MKKILIIDDKHDNLIAISAVIKNHFSDIDIFTALSGKEGLNLAHQRQPDTIILDIKMPVMDGFEVCRILKAKDNTKHIPIILLTAVYKIRKVMPKDLIQALTLF